MTAQTATYAINSSTMFGRGAEIVKGVVTGSAASVNKLREISEDELQQCEWPQPLFAFTFSSSTGFLLGFKY